MNDLQRKEAVKKFLSEVKKNEIRIVVERTNRNLGHSVKDERVFLLAENAREYFAEKKAEIIAEYGDDFYFYDPRENLCYGEPLVWSGMEDGYKVILYQALETDKHPDYVGDSSGSTF